MKQTENQNLPAVVGEPPEDKNTPLFIFTHVVTAFLILVTVIHCILVSISQYRLIFSGVSIILLIVLRKMKKVHGFLPVAGKTILAVADTFLLSQIVLRILDKGSVPRGAGAILCLREELSAIDRNTFILPIWMI